MVYGLGGHHFRDFVLFGVPLNILMGIVALIVIPLVWPFHIQFISAEYRDAYRGELLNERITRLRGLLFVRHTDADRLLDLTVSFLRRSVSIQTFCLSSLSRWIGRNSIIFSYAYAD
jgi:hypothetical protein